MISEIIITAIILLFSYIIAKKRGGKTLVPEEPWYRVVPKGEVFQTHKMEFMDGLEKTGQEERFTLPEGRAAEGAGDIRGPVRGSLVPQVAEIAREAEVEA